MGSSNPNENLNIDVPPLYPQLNLVNSENSQSNEATTTITRPTPNTTAVLTSETSNTTTVVAFSNTNQTNQSVAFQQAYIDDQKDLFQKRLNENYPAKTITQICIMLLVTNVILILLEWSYTSTLERDNKYGTWYARKYLSLTTVSNIIYSIVGIATRKIRIYWLIQLLALLFFMAFIASVFHFVVFDFINFLALLILGYCGFICVLIELCKVFFGLVSALISFALFFKIQIKFIKQLNDNTFEQSA